MAPHTRHTQHTQHGYGLEGVSVLRYSRAGRVGCARCPAQLIASHKRDLGGTALASLKALLLQFLLDVLRSTSRGFVLTLLRR